MNRTLLTVFIIWGALCGSLCVYAAMLSSMTFAPGPAAPSTMGSFIAVMAASAVALSFLMRKLLLGGFASGSQSVDDPAQSGRFIAGHIVVFALSEGIGVLGFVNGISSNGRGDAWLPYMGLSLALMLAHIPLPSRFRPAA